MHHAVAFMAVPVAQAARVLQAPCVQVQAAQAPLRLAQVYHRDRLLQQTSQTAMFSEWKKSLLPLQWHRWSRKMIAGVA